MPNQIDLFFWPTPNGRKITIFLEEAGLDYKLHFINIGAGDQFDPAFLVISPNNRIPAIVDHDGPGSAPVSIFESGAILQYLGRKTGKFYPSDDRARIAVDEWLMWQMGGVGPMLGQFHHFHNYAPDKIEYAMMRYENEAHRLYGVLNKRLAENEYVAGDYSIADMAIISWTAQWERHHVELEKYPHFDRWRAAVMARPGVERGLAVGADKRKDLTDDETRKILFNQRGQD